MSTMNTMVLRELMVLVPGAMAVLFCVALRPLPALAQTCPDAGAYCEGWARDSSHREVSLSRTIVCHSPDETQSCPATCPTQDITALPSIRVNSYDHIVLGFAAPNGCTSSCPWGAESCWNLGVAYRHAVASGSEDVTGTYDCDPVDPGTVVAAGATFNATYETGGTVNIVISNIVYGFGIGTQDCGTFPTALDLTATGPSLGIQSHFAFTWGGAAGDQVVGYTETRTYTLLPAPQNTVHITVSNINYGAQTYAASAPDASTPAMRTSWGSLKVLYR
jgi:hypothetical protein